MSLRRHIKSAHIHVVREFYDNLVEKVIDSKNNRIDYSQKIYDLISKKLDEVEFVPPMGGEQYLQAQSRQIQSGMKE